MIRNKIYDELEKEGYTFQRIRANGRAIPEVFHLENPDDWAVVNTTMIVNGQYQVAKGSAATSTTIRLLQRVLEEVAKPDYSDWYSKALFENKDEE